MRRIAAVVVMAQLVASAGCLTWAAQTPRKERTWSEFAKWGTVDVGLGGVPSTVAVLATGSNDYQMIPASIFGIVLLDAGMALLVELIEDIPEDAE